MFDINNNLFGYIEKSSEMNDAIIQRYKNSLIFIGDERQIYVPTTNSYVGVGLSTIDDIKNRISVPDKIYIKDIANNSLTNPDTTTYYFPVINGTTPNAYYYTYVALNVGINPVSGKFIGGLQGTADYSTVSNLTYKNEIKSTSNNSTYYLIFSNNTSGNSYAYVNGNLKYNPNTKTLTTDKFVGNLDGNAKTATNATNATNSTYATYSHFNSYQSIHNTNTNDNYYITFGKNLAYSLSYIDNGFYYNPSLNCVYFGTAYGNIYGNVVGNINGTANYSVVSNLTYKTTTKSTNNNSSYYISFVNKINDESYTYVNNKLLYNPYEETLKSTYFVGNLKGHAETADYATYSTYTSYTTYALFNSYQSVHSINNNSNYYITFSKNLAYSLSYIDNEFYYNPELNCVYFGTAYGNVYGSADTVDGFHANTLFQEFKDNGNQYTYIRIGNTDKQLKIDADKLDGKHLTELFQNFRNGDNNCAYIKIGNVEKYLQLNTYTLGGKTKEELFTNFSNSGSNNNETSITIGDTTKTLFINADKLDGYHANNLLSYYKSGTISSAGNTLTQANTYITVGGNTLYTNGSTCNIINSHTVNTLSTSNTENLKVKVSVNGVSAEKAITYLHAYYLAGTKKEDLFTNFSDGGNQTTSITIGGTTKTLAINAATLDGFDASGLLTYFTSGTISSNGNTLTQANTYITVGGNTLYTNSSTCNIINSHTASGGQLTSDTNTMSLSAHTDNVNGITSTISKSSAYIINSLSVTGNQISSSVNTMSLDPLTVNVNGVTDSTTKSTAQIINSLSVSTLTSTNATNLTAAITINGVASDNKTITDLIARQIAQTSISSLSSFTNDNNLIYAAAGGSNTVSDKPTNVDAFGVLSFKTAAGWYGQLLMSSNEATGLYWRTATTLSGGWKKLLDSSNYTDYVYSKTTADDRYVLKAGDIMTGTLTLKTAGTGNYNQGIRINRTATNQWALLLIGKSGDSTYGPGTSTAGDGAWLIGTPASSNSLIFNLNDASESKGLCLKGHGNNDIKWNNNNVAHAGNISNKDATIGTSLTEIATIAGVSIKTKIASYSLSTHLHDDRYVKLSSTEQTIESTISSFTKGIIEFYRSSGNHIAFISFANKDDNGNKRTLGSIGFHSGAVGQLEYRTPDGTYYKIAHAGNITNNAVSLTTSYQTLAKIAGIDISAKVDVSSENTSILTSLTKLATVAGVEIKAKVDVSNKAASITTSPTTLATIAGKDITAKIAVSNKDATIGTTSTTIATVAGQDITAKIGSLASSNHTHSIKTHGNTYTIPATGSAAVDIGNYVYVAGDTMTGHLKMQGTKNLGSAWDKGVIAGNDGHDKVVLTYLASSTNGATIGAHNSDLNAWALLNISGSQLVFRNNETERMRLNASGNLGIGTSSPAEKLDVNGNVRIRGNNEYIGTGSGSQCHMQYDNTNKCLNFIFD